MTYSSPSSLLALAVFFLNFTTILMILRVVARRMQRAALGADDVLALLAWMATVAMCIITITGVAYRLWGIELPFLEIDTRHASQKAIMQAKFTPVQAQSGQLDFINTTFFFLQLFLSKLSIIFYLRRVFVTRHGGFMHFATLTLIPVVTMWGILLFIEYIFQCSTDLSLNWLGPLIAIQSRCLRLLIGVVLQSFDPLWDVLILILPLRTIARLQMPLSKKLMVAAVFGVGALSVAASFVGLGTNLETMMGARQSVNYNVELSQAEFWQLFEAGFAVAAACLPSIHFLVRRAVACVISTNCRQSPAIVSNGLRYPAGSPAAVEKPSLRDRFAHTDSV